MKNQLKIFSLNLIETDDEKEFVKKSPLISHKNIIER